MEKRLTKSSASTQSGLMEWQVCKDEREWELLYDAGVAKADAAPRPLHWNRRKLLRQALVLAFLLLALGIPSLWWLWHQAELGEAKTQNELRATADADLWGSVHLPATQSNDSETSYIKELISQSQDGEQEQVTTVEIRNQRDDWALVRVLLRLQSNGSTYRQTRLYRNGERGWQRIEVTSDVWGQERQYETAHFIFEYHSLDHDAVIQAASLLEPIYLSLYHALFTGNASPEKVVIVVDPEKHLALRQLQEQPQTPVTVGSPSVLLAPSELSEGEILAQAVVLELAFRLTQEASVDYAVPVQWHNLQDGLRLWLLWHQELPLAAWKKPVVHWVFSPKPSELSLDDLSATTFAYRLCANHAMWMITPLEIGIWLFCLPHGNTSGSKIENQILSWRLPLPQMVQIPPSLAPSDQYDRTKGLRSSPSDIVVLSTVIDYIVARYGGNRLPALLAALRQHQNWQTLTPSLFGVSQEEFSQGWHEFLHKEYGIPQ